MRSGKPAVSSTSERGTTGAREVVEDLGDDLWNFMSFCNKDFVKDSIPDKQLSLQELTLRYKGEFTKLNGCNRITAPCCLGGLLLHVERSQTRLQWLCKKRMNAAAADTKKSVLKTIATMDLDKINMDLVENLLEWIVDGKHDYPPGKNPADPLCQCGSWFSSVVSPSRCGSGVSARPG